MSEEILFNAWGAGKHINLNDVNVTGVGKTLANLFNEAKNMREFDLNTNQDSETLFKASMYLLFHKFYTQLHKRGGKKGTAISTGGVEIWTAGDEKERDERGKVTKGATIKKRLYPINVESVKAVFPNEYAKLLAKGFFPIGFVSKLFVFTEGVNGATMRAKVATVDGKKEIQFVRKFAKNVDYDIVTNPPGTNPSGTRQQTTSQTRRINRHEVPSSPNVQNKHKQASKPTQAEVSQLSQPVGVGQ